MIEQIKNNIYKISNTSNFYYYKDLNLLIDCGCRCDLKIITEEFSKICNFDSIKFIICTHLHYDHIGNYNLFKNSKLIASNLAIDDYNKYALDTILNEIITEELKSKQIYSINELSTKIKEKFDFITTPGHTNGSICILDKKEKILFSGDTLFYNQVLGRTDLPTSKPELYSKSLEKLFFLDFKILCPGHDY